MRKVPTRNMPAVAAAFVALGLAAGTASALSYCYKWNAFPQERIRIEINFVGTLTLPVEERNFSHPSQDAYSVFGKHVGVCGPGTMATVTGTIVRADQGAGGIRNNNGPKGFHMGLRTHSVRVANLTNIFCKEVTLECSTPEEPRGITPSGWICASRNEWDVTHIPAPSTLTLVGPNEDPLCSIFENGTFLQTPPLTSGASGLMEQ